MVNDSFIKIECQSQTDGKVKRSVEFHGIALPPEIKSAETKKKAEYWNDRKNDGITESPPNILVIGTYNIYLVMCLPTQNFPTSLKEYINYMEHEVEECMWIVSLNVCCFHYRHRFHIENAHDAVVTKDERVSPAK